MVSYVFCLIPEKKINSKIISLKERINKTLGDQLYLSDAPHLTLYLGNFNNLFDKKWEKFLRKSFSKRLKTVNLMPRQIFTEDPITKKQTIIYPLSKNKDLFRFQKKIINTLRDKKSKILLQRYQNSELGGVLKKNLYKYGYPFVGKIWIPHFGIASFDKKSICEAIQISSKSLLQGTFQFEYFVVYELNETNEKLKEVKRYKLHVK